MGWSIFEYDNDFVTVTSEKINKIPCLKFKPKGYNGTVPTVIFYHGWHSNKDFIRFKAFTIATYGYQVIVPDALHHGDRDPINHDDPKNLEKYFWKIVLQSCEESKEFIKEIMDKHEADSNRIAIMGSSMGAIIAGVVFTNNPNVKCLIGFNGAFSWQQFININADIIDDKHTEELIELYDPINNLNKLNSRPVLILHGTNDTSVSIECQKMFYQKALPFYKNNIEKLCFISDTVDHRVSIGMMQDAVSWLKKYL